MITRRAFLKAMGAAFAACGLPINAETKKPDDANPLISTDWSYASTDIMSEIEGIKARMKKYSGYEPTLYYIPANVKLMMERELGVDRLEDVPFSKQCVFV